MLLYFALAGFTTIVLVALVRFESVSEDMKVAFGMIFALFFLMRWSFALEEALRPLTWDFRLRAIDLALGLDGLRFTALCQRFHFVDVALTQIYWSLPFAFALNWTVERSRLSLRAAIVGGVASVPFYWLVPACGPRVAFAIYPASSGAPTWALAAVPSMFVRNCFPSMHLSWALLMAMNSRARAWRIVMWTFAVLTAASTITTGQHYVIDLIAAVPFTFGVQWVAEEWPEWRLRRAAKCSAVPAD